MKIKDNRRIIKVKPLPLNPFSDQNEVIKPINHRKRQFYMGSSILGTSSMLNVLIQHLPLQLIF